MEGHNKKARYVDINILLWFHSPGDFCVGLGIQASKETARKLKFNIRYYYSLMLGLTGKTEAI